MVSRYTTLVPSLGLRIGSACEAGLSAGMQRERVPLHRRKKERKKERKELELERRRPRKWHYEIPVTVIGWRWHWTSGVTRGGGSCPLPKPRTLSCSALHCTILRLTGHRHAIVIEPLTFTVNSGCCFAPVFTYCSRKKRKQNFVMQTSVFRFFWLNVKGKIQSYSSK